MSNGSERIPEFATLPVRWTLTDGEGRESAAYVTESTPGGGVYELSAAALGGLLTKAGYVPEATDLNEGARRLAEYEVVQ